MKYADKQVKLRLRINLWVLLMKEQNVSKLQTLLHLCVHLCQCADEAMAALHGRVVNGVKMKVMLADPPREESHKRPRTY